MMRLGYALHLIWDAVVFAIILYFLAAVAAAF